MRICADRIGSQANFCVAGLARPIFEGSHQFFTNFLAAVVFIHHQTGQFHITAGHQKGVDHPLNPAHNLPRFGFGHQNDGSGIGVEADQPILDRFSSDG